jgi:MscS family membrane protein
MALLSFSEGVNVILANRQLTALVGFALFVIVIVPLLRLIEKALLWLVRHTETTADDELADRLNPTAIWFFSFLALKYAYDYSGFLAKYATKIDAALDTALIAIAFYALFVFLDVLLEHAGKRLAKKTKSTADDNLISLGRKVLRFLIITFGFLAILSSWGINITSVLAGLGIAGIAIGFAVKDSLANIFGGISIIMDHTFRIGDKIQIDSGEVGVIKDIGVRSTKIQDYDNKEIIIPNGVMANAKIINYTKPDKKMRFVVDFGVAYGSDPDKVKKIVLAAIKKTKKVIKEPEPAVIFTEMADSALSFKGMGWVDDYNDAYMVHKEATQNIYKALNKAKIVIPFPQMDVHMKK